MNQEAIFLSIDEFVFLSSVFGIKKIYGIKNISYKLEENKIILSLIEKGAIILKSNKAISIIGEYCEILKNIKNATQIISFVKDNSMIWFSVSKQIICFEFCKNQQDVIAISVYGLSELENIILEKDLIPKLFYDSDIVEIKEQNDLLGNNIDIQQVRLEETINIYSRDNDECEYSNMFSITLLWDDKEYWIVYLENEKEVTRYTPGKVIKYIMDRV